MKFVLASLLLGAATAATNPFVAKSKNSAASAYTSKLVAGARRLNDAEEEEYEVDISGYAVKFEKCQFVKSYSDDMAEDEEAGTVLATQRFVVFRLCPNNSCGSCNYNYGEYMVDLETYLEATIQYQQELQEEMCNQCDENCQQDEEEEEDGRRKLAVDCDSCVDECEKIENMEENGYVDATEFLECQQIYEPEDDNAVGLWAGPMCASSGSKIKIGVFEDENCNNVDNSKNVDDYLVDGDGYQIKLSHALLKTVYSDTCISCLVVEEEEENEDEDEDDNQEEEEEQEPEVAEMCQQLYEGAAKCEKNHGFDNGFAEYDAYENQLAQEDVVCDFISSIKSGTYQDNGEISLYGNSKNVKGSSSTTGGQKFGLTFFILGSVALAAYAAMLHGKLSKGSQAGLASQGGAMA
jgi:hypothetical protein